MACFMWFSAQFFSQKRPKIRFQVRPNGQSYPLIELSGHNGPVWKVSWAHPKYGGLLASAAYDK